VLAIVERDYLSVLADLVDPDPCWFDHHGGCQAHGYLSLEPGEKCPHEQAKRLLAELKAAHLRPHDCEAHSPHPHVNHGGTCLACPQCFGLDGSRL
jgi:hypothetical protein